MPNPTFLGYLDQPYLEDPYLSGTGLHAWGMQINRLILDDQAKGMQVSRTIADFPKYNAMQVNRFVTDDKPMGMQTTLNITDDQAKGMQVNRLAGATKSNAMQVNRFVLDDKPMGMQTTLNITERHESGMQVARTIANYSSPRGMQVSRTIVDFPKYHGMEIRLDATWPHLLCEDLGYLSQPYLETPYLARGYCVHGGMQINRFIKAEDPNGMQVTRFIPTQKYNGMQVLRFIADYPAPSGMQINLFHALTNGMQVRLVLYNNHNLRIMCEFPSRGTSGLNWTATSTQAGDFSVNNLNTDIVEQRWQSNTSITSVTLTCDTQVVQGVPVDTIAILNHNLTTSAVVTVEASNSPTFSPVQFTVNIEPLKTNAYYIAPTFPLDQFRYWRFVITDPTNPDGQLKIGTIIFGTTIILQGECFVDEVTRRLRHFSDKVQTEGFTNVSNDRALKQSISLEFRMLEYAKGNFKNLKGVFEFARTSLKCLWIPDPQDIDRFTTFGKLVQIPEERHKNMGEGAADIVAFNIEVDESL